MAETNIPQIAFQNFEMFGDKNEQKSSSCSAILFSHVYFIWILTD